MKVVIIEDDPQAAAQLKKHLSRLGEETQTEFEIAHYRDAEVYLKNHTREHPEIIFLDIELSTIDGMEAARQLRKQDSAVVLVFVTKMVQFAQEGYAVNALDFLVKPVSYAEFKMKIQRAVNVARANQVRMLQVPFDGGFYRIPCDKIVFVEVTGHRLQFQLVDGTMEARGSLSSVEEKLEGWGFLRCNSCYIVNARYIESVKGYDLFIGGHQLRISHPRRKEFMRRLMEIYADGTETK